MSEVTRKDREAGWLAYVSVSGGAAGIPDWAERWLEHGDPEPSTSLLRAFAQAIADAREEGRQQVLDMVWAAGWSEAEEIAREIEAMLGR